MSVKLSFWLLIVSGIPDFLSFIPEFKAQESGIQSKNFPDSLTCTLGTRGFSSRATGGFVLSAEGRRQPLAPRVPYMGRKICEQSQGNGTSSLSLISPLFSFAHAILMSLRQWKINFQPKIKRQH